MKTSVLSGFLLFQSLVCAHTPPAWDFRKAYESSKDVFIAEVMEVETSLEIESDIVGEVVETGEIVRIIWADARRFKLSVQEVFKGEQPKVFDVYNYGEPGFRKEEGYQGELARIWSPVGGFGSSARPRLEKGAKYLFFIDRNNDTEVAEIGWRSAFSLKWMEEELRMLRAMSSGGAEVSLDEAHKLNEERMQELVGEKAERDSTLRAEYHDILNANPNLEKRRQKLAEHIRKLGFDDLWHQSNSTNRKDSYPPEKIEEEIWYNASQEIRKIDMILAARSEKGPDTDGG